jgi:hypothetical protein
MDKTLSDRELERTLSEIGQRLPSPSRDMWPAVRERIDQRRARRWWNLGVPRGMLAPIAATIAVLLVVALALTPDLVARAAEVLGLRGVQIFRVTATPSPAPTAGAPVTFAGQRAGSLEEAGRIAGFPVRAPTGLGPPDEIYVESAPVRVTLVYRSRQGLPATALPGIGALVVEFRGRLDQAVVGKTAGPEVHLESVPLNGGVALWLSGQPHQFFYFDPNGNFQPETLRLAGNTLLWEAGGLTYRLEAQVGKEEAVRIASTLR